MNDVMYVLLRSIRYYLSNFENLKNTYGGVLFLVMLEAVVYNFMKSIIPPWANWAKHLICTQYKK